jgi:ATP-dependent Clp protease ATP-binding subunit ClpA
MTPPPSLQELIETVRRDAGSGSPLDQLVTAATTVAQLEDTTDALLGHFVDRCRREGRSWSEISAALGVTKQAVHKRFATTMADQIIAAVPSPTLERFTMRARNVLAAARREAQAARRPQVGSEHILLGLFTEPEGIAAQALDAVGVSPAVVREAIQSAPAAPPVLAPEPGQAGESGQADQAVPTGEPGQAGESGIRFGPDALAVLRDALAVALELGHNYIGTEHLLLALPRDSQAPGAVVLANAGASEAALRAVVLERLQGFQAPGGGRPQPPPSSR